MKGWYDLQSDAKGAGARAASSMAARELRMTVGCWDFFSGESLFVGFCLISLVIYQCWVFDHFSTAEIGLR